MLESVRKAQELMVMTGFSRHGAADALRQNEWDVYRSAKRCCIEKRYVDTSVWAG